MSRATLLYILCGVLLNAVAQMLLKAAALRLGPLSPEYGGLTRLGMRILGEPGVWVGLLCYGLSVILWIVALSRAPVSQAYPFLSLGYVITALAAWQLFDEPLSMQRLGSIALICLGVGLLYRS